MLVCSERAYNVPPYEGRIQNFPQQAHDMRNEVGDRWDRGERLSGGEVVAERQRENLAAPVF
jgi:hypothetical protein